VIDASTAHRVAQGWTYGFPEIVGRETVAEAKRIANPGCYPTGFIALLAPLVRANLLPVAWPYSCNAVSGYSGGGKALIERFEADSAIAWRGYGLAFGHKHLAEMQAYAHLAIEPLFFPRSCLPIAAWSWKSRCRCRSFRAIPIRSRCVKRWLRSMPVRRSSAWSRMRPTAARS
jgi:N-acetyl-gamma-glutamylphosphate reductase